MNFIPLILAMIFAPLMVGVINRVKAIFGGRRGQPLLQLYFDIWKLLHKGAVYSRTTSWVFRAGPIVTLAGVLVATALMPLSSCPSLVSFSGDLILFAYLLALGRFFTVAAALDTGSAFEGMGASREVFFSTLAEPALLLGLAGVAKKAIGTPLISLTEIHRHVTPELWAGAGLILLFVAIAFVLVYLAENSRIPVDDPNTHLELTMIHEVMVLDHSGPDLAFIQYGAALKLWVLGALIVGMVVPNTGSMVIDLATSLIGMFALAILVGVIESVMGRLRLLQVSQLLVGSEGPSARLFLVAAVILAMKGIVFPKLLFRSLRSANVVHESTPIVGHTASLVLGIAILIVSFWLTSRFPLPAGQQPVSNLVLPVALATLLSGLLLIVSRRLALMHVVGYLVLENGIFVFGVGLAHEEPLLIEMGILLDVFVAVLVMGIPMFHISRTFDHIDVDQLSQLRD